MRAVIPGPGEIAGSLGHDPGRRLDDEQRQRAVDVKARPAIVGVEAALRRVEVLADARHRRDAGHHLGQEALVRVQVGEVIPVQPHKAEVRARSHHQQEQQGDQDALPVDPPRGPARRDRLTRRSAGRLRHLG